MTIAQTVHTVLDNGVRVVVAPRPTMPVATVHVRMDVGSRHETAGRTGLAHLFEHLMFAATRRLASGDHIRAVEELGGYSNATTTTDSTSYFETLPPGGFELALWLESQRLAHLPDAVDEEVLTAQRAVVANERRQAIDNTPYGDATDLLAAAMFAQPHHYHHTPIGSMADIEAAGLDDVVRFFRDNYRPGRTLVCVTGGVNPGEALAAVATHFAGLTSPAGPPMPPAGTGAALAREHIRLVRHSAAPSNLIIAHHVPAAGRPEWDRADLLGHLLATGKASRLHHRLTRDRALAANIRVTVAPMAVGDAMMVVRLRPALGVDVEALEQAYLDELRSLAVHGPDESELDRARAQWTMGWLSDIETGKGLAEHLTWQWLTRGSAPEPGQARTRIDQLSTEDIRLGAWALYEARRVSLTYRSG